MSDITTLIDDKYVPLYRIMWIAATPHFCGEEDCVREGQYEVRLEQEESLWASRIERDQTLAAINGGRGTAEGNDPGDDQEGNWG